MKNALFITLTFALFLLALPTFAQTYNCRLGFELKSLDFRIAGDASIELGESKTIFENKNYKEVLILKEDANNPEKQIFEVVLFDKLKDGISENPLAKPVIIQTFSAPTQKGALSLIFQTSKLSRDNSKQDSFFLSCDLEEEIKINNNEIDKDVIDIDTIPENHPLLKKRALQF